MENSTNIAQFQQIVVLTGAGISAESGLKTFRDNNGLWENHSMEQVATPEAFKRDPSLVYRFYNQRRAQLHDNNIKPNRAHEALADFSQRTQSNFTLITQNVDDLHEKAGSENVLHMHGELNKARCVQTNVQHISAPYFDNTTPCPCCSQAGNLRPDIVWFGEIPYYMDEIQQALSRADLFVAIGTSGSVYPAAGFVAAASANGAYCVELNMLPSDNQNSFDQGYYGPATEIVPPFFTDLLDKQDV